MPTLTTADAQRLEACLTGGGVALFPADTVYGLACDPDSEPAVQRLYELKGRPAQKPAAVLFFSLTLALDVLGDLRESERMAARALLPGPVTLLLPNPGRRFPLACGPDPLTLGLRVPALDEPIAALEAVGVAVMQSSANLSGEREARRLEDVPAPLREGVALALDAGVRPGVASTVVDLRRWEQEREFAVPRVGALPEAVVASSLSP